MEMSSHAVGALRVARNVIVVDCVIFAADKRRGFHGALAHPFRPSPRPLPLLLQKLLLLGADRELEPPPPGGRPPQELLTARPGQVPVRLKIRRLAATSTSSSSPSSSSHRRQHHRVAVGLTLTVEEHLSLVVVDGLLVAVRGRRALGGPVEGLGLGLGLGLSHAGPAEGARASAGQVGHLAVLAADRLQSAGPQLPVLARQPVGHHVALALQGSDGRS